MYWSEYRTLLLRRGWIILCGALLGAIGAWLATQTQPSLYRAHTFISMVPADMDWRVRDLTKELARNDAAQFPTRGLVQDVQTAIAPDMDVQALTQALNARFDHVTLIFTIEALHANPDMARMLATAAAQAHFAERSAYFAAQEFEGYIKLALAPAAPEVIRLSPNTRANTLAGLVLGLFAGTALVLLLYWRDEEKLARPDIAARTLDLPVLGSLALSRHSRPPDPDPGTAQPDAAAFHALRARIELARNSAGSCTLVVAGVTHRTPVARILQGLGLAFAAVELDVLLVDADSQAPALHRTGNLSLAPGLYQWLARDVAEIPIQPVAGHNIRVLAAGMSGTDPLQALSVERVRHLHDSLRALASIVIWHVPPLDASAAGSMIASQADAAILAVQMGQEQRGTAIQARDQLVQAGARLIGTVVCTFPRKT